jgi:hypothetical protein
VNRRCNALIITAILTYAGIATLSSYAVGFRLPKPQQYFESLLLDSGILFIGSGLVFLFVLAWARPESPLSYTKALLARLDITARSKIVGPIFIAIPLFDMMFSRMKSAIPQFHAFSWDRTFANWDAALHGGDAWRLVHPIVGYPLITWAINWSYHLWVAAMLGVTIIANCMTDRPQLRAQYLLSYVLCWSLIGTLLAIIFSSVGPCFYQALYGDDRYRDLMNYLYATNEAYRLPALQVQQALWNMQASPEGHIGTGISAMPSMHVSMACLLALFASQFGRAWGGLGLGYLALIMIGSVHLGYHYAIDGYVSLILTPILWFAAGKITRSSWLRGREPQLATA